MGVSDGQAFNKHECNAIQSDLRDIRQLCKLCRSCTPCNAKQELSAESFVQPLAKSKEGSGGVIDV